MMPEVDINNQMNSRVWIVKPAGMSRGRGIHLVQDPHDVSLGEPLVVQKYISNPLLFGGYKFDLRVYVLVTSFNPLEAWIYTEGFARFTTEKYNLDTEDLSNSFIHLTNATIQNSSDWKTVGADISPNNPYRCGILPGSSKMLLSRLWELLGRNGINKDDIWAKCREVILTALFVAQVGIDNQVVDLNASPENFTQINHNFTTLGRFCNLCCKDCCCDSVLAKVSLLQRTTLEMHS